ncbi:hypothetical protein [Bacteroides sp. 51]|uniref:hypothetical protein n=1 Tax=Bacteroides sp. 51 TaxID=2302938 RepID=UPI0013D7F85D|nr:hypothetical protein [Bacteroides sp. 51]NDV80588.1 hypothetical protein [Bacteroides sp. 51]
MKRRNFIRTLFVSGAGIMTAPVIKAAAPDAPSDLKPQTNIETARNIPRTMHSMPGKYPGKVVKANHPNPVVSGKNI